MKRKISIRNLREKAEALFHKYICKRDKYICFTCGKAGNQAGHLFHGRLDFDEMNLHCQCVSCNKYRHGMRAEYVIKLDKLCGAGTAELLQAKSWQDENKFNREQLTEIIKKYAE